MAAKLRVALRKFEPFERAIAKQFEAFKAETGSALEIEIVSLDLNPLVETLFTNEGLKDGTWDVALIVTDWLADAIATGALTDLKPSMDRTPVPDYPEGWVPVLTRSQQVGQSIYGLPYHDGPECLIYRTDLFANPDEQARFLADYGYPLAVPTTWAQFEDVARHFNQPHKGLFGTVFAAYPDGHNSVYDFCLQLWSRGGELTDATGAITLDTPQARDAVDFYRRLVRDRTVTPPVPETIDSVASGERFAVGSVAMMVNWFGFAAVCEQPGCAMKGKVGIAPIPTSDGNPPASLIVYWLLTVAAGSQYKEDAYAFIRFCATVAGDRITTLEGGIGCRMSTWTDPEVNSLIPYYHRLAELHQGTRELPRSRSLPALVHIIDRAIHEALATDESTESILRRAQAAAENTRLEE
jgi:multiple sugar transport system substrate-binding protein